MNIKLSKLLKGLILKEAHGISETEISGLAYHTDQVESGALFFAVPGTKAYGWEYVKEALNKGASAVVVPSNAPSLEAPNIRVPDVRLALAVASDIFYDHPSGKMRLTGVTGTNGKTTTTHLINAILEKGKYQTGLIGTIDYRVAGEALPVLATTPEASDLQRMLAYMEEKGVNHGILEVSSHALSWRRVYGCDFDIAVLTNITSDHLDFHGDFENYRSAKASLFAQMGGGVTQLGKPRAAVLNKDDPNFSFFEDMAASQVVTYGIENTSDVQATDLVLDQKMTSFRVHSFSGEFQLNLHLRGKFNVYNALAAVTTGLIEGVDISVIKEALEEVRGIPGRFEKVEVGQDFLVVVDYAHTSDSLENILQGAHNLAKGGKLITVFGCGGDRDKTKRPLMGKIAGRYSDFCVVTSDNPRTEDPEAIIENILPGVREEKNSKEYEVLVDREQAIRKAIEKAQKNDVIVIAGKGHEEYQIFRDQVLPFSDRQIAKKAIKETKPLDKQGAD